RKPLSGLAVRFLTPRVNAERLDLDFRRVEESKRRAEAKLGKMIDYVHTASCRTNHILTYFGQEATAPCGRCDNCRSGREDRGAASEYAREATLRALMDYDRGVPESSLVHILRGTSDAKRYARLETRGALSSFVPREIRALAATLRSEGLVAFGKNGRRLFLTEKGLAALRDSGALDEKTSTLTIEQDVELFERLADVRAAAARRFGQPATLVLGDDALKNVVRAKPTDREALLAVPGFSKRAMHKLGEELLRAVDEFLVASTLRDDRPARAPETEPAADELPRNVVPAFELASRGKTIPEIATELRLPEALVSMQLETAIERRPDADVSRLVEKDAFAEIERLWKEGVEDLTALKERLTNDAPYATIRVALAKIRATSR
ncbi:MAG: hypothetical protein GF419_04785, partial [Ignavibacteriales bacterium]|nr:hypothetical protein [Ignavibacteriales bacterium]